MRGGIDRKAELMVDSIWFCFWGLNGDKVVLKWLDALCKHHIRGSNVDEDALLAALESGKVRGAGLDVFAEEPSANHALYSHPMVACTPHIGAATQEAQKRIGSEIVSIIANFWSIPCLYSII